MALATIQKVNLKIEQSPSLDNLVGHTPLLPLRRIFRDLASDVAVYSKAEWFNPSGSVKDRPALQIILDALQTGELTPNKRLLDSTSGNMGIAYATLCAARGIRVTLVIPENASKERIAILKVMGAELILTDPLEGSDGAIRIARKLAAKHPERYFYANQYDNPANWQAHFKTTGPEIMEQTRGTITHFVAGMGTSGTLMGTGRYLRTAKENVRIIGIQPDSPFHGLEGLKHIESAIQPKIFDNAILDQVIEVRTEQVYEMVHRLAREEGLFVGISSGAAALAAYEIAKKLDRGVIVTIFPDAGYKYLSDNALWA